MNQTRRIPVTQRRVTLVLLIIFGCGCFATTAMSGAQATGAPPPAPAAERDGQHDFDFIFGRWKIHLKRRVHVANGPDRWNEFDGFGVYRKVWDGRANLNEFEADSASGHVQGLTLRTYNPQTHQWSLYWANSQDGILDIPQVGQFNDGQGEFYAQDTLDGKSQFIRYVWTHKGADSAHFEQALSADGGRTWNVNWISDMVRVSADAGTSLQPAKATPATAPAVSSIPDGQRDFDPLIGSWKFGLKRRMNPLTGSTHWVELTGTGACYPLWGGKAQLDTVSLDGPGGRIEGITLRLYNPKTHQWRLYWANSKDGIVAVPQIGEFSKGHGAFYAQDTLDDKGILVRFDWTGMASASPHFEQSFSADGGKTWEVNWITDQKRSGDSR
jgi:hypothetical protein